MFKVFKVICISGLLVSASDVNGQIKGESVSYNLSEAPDSVYEAVYFRPFNFNTADPVRRIHAVQYVFHPLFTWLKLRTENNGQYEKAVNPAPQADDWFHVKLIMLDARIEVFINESMEACLSVERLSSIKSGKIGLWTGNDSDGSFANLKITRFSE